MAFKKTKAENEKHIRYRNRLIVALLALNALQTFGWMAVQRDITVRYPPDLRTATSRKVGDIEPSEIYAFAGHVFTYLNTWQENGGRDYPAQRKRLRAFLTQTYQKEILADIESLKGVGEIQNRIRYIQPLPMDFYDDSKVEILSKSSWIVTRHYRIKEYLSGELVKDVPMTFKIKVTTYNVPHEYNPWQLALNGFAEPPKRIPYLKGDFDK